MKYFTEAFLASDRTVEKSEVASCGKSLSTSRSLMGRR